jgi:hypothetical protein
MRDARYDVGQIFAAAVRPAAQPVHRPRDLAVTRALTLESIAHSRVAFLPHQAALHSDATPVRCPRGVDQCDDDGKESDQN